MNQKTMEGMDWPLFMATGGVFMSVLCYYWHNFTNSYYWSLKGLQHIQLSDLLSKVVENGGRIPYIALTGAVCADETPIQGLSNTHARGKFMAGAGLNFNNETY